MGLRRDAWVIEVKERCAKRGLTPVVVKDDYWYAELVVQFSADTTQAERRAAKELAKDFQRAPVPQVRMTYVRPNPTSAETHAEQLLHNEKYYEGRGELAQKRALVEFFRYGALMVVVRD